MTPEFDHKISAIYTKKKYLVFQSQSGWSLTRKSGEVKRPQAINGADSNNDIIYDGNTTNHIDDPEDNSTSDIDGKKDVEENGYANKGNQDNLTKASEGKSKHSATDKVLTIHSQNWIKVMMTMVIAMFTSMSFHFVFFKADFSLRNTFLCPAFPLDYTLLYSPFRYFPLPLTPLKFTKNFPVLLLFTLLFMLFGIFLLISAAYWKITKK